VLGSGTLLKPGETRDPEMRVASFARTVAELERLTDGRRLLDVGCGPGALAEAARRRGWVVTGVEPGDYHFLIDVIRAHWEPGVVPSGSADVVTMVEVIEHVADPLAALSTAHDALVEGGILHLTAPNYATVDRILYPTQTREGLFDPPRHRFMWAGRDLVRLVERAGFETIVAQPQVSRVLRRRGERMISHAPDAGSIIPGSEAGQRRWVAFGTTAARRILPGPSIRIYARRSTRRQQHAL
jgi:SAM-dependent methyltransferase